jgi:hypothetical protein
MSVPFGSASAAHLHVAEQYEEVGGAFVILCSYATAMWLLHQAARLLHSCALQSSMLRWVGIRCLVSTMLSIFSAVVVGIAGIQRRVGCTAARC